MNDGQIARAQTKMREIIKRNLPGTAADLSFVAPHIVGVEGLVTMGSGSHSPNEPVNLPSLVTQAASAVVMLYRLPQEKVENSRWKPSM
jgi:hypothetical protein